MPKNYNFYTIESYKLLKTEDDLYYCSFDPIDSELSISENDGAIIMSKYIEGYYSFDLKINESKKIEFIE